MKTFQQFSETMMMPLRATKVAAATTWGRESHKFEIGGVQYSANFYFRGHGEVEMEYGVDRNGKGYGMIISPIGTQKHYFQVLSTVLDLIKKKLDEPGVEQVYFTGSGKLNDLYRTIAKRFHMGYYIVKQTRLGEEETLFTVTKRST